MNFKLTKFLRDKYKKANEDLYIKVLLWTHEKQETGFTFEDLKKHFLLNSTQEGWVRKIFFTTSDSDRKFFEHLKNDDSKTPNQHYYSLNEKGITAAINYKSLSHAEKTSGLAIWFAGLSIFLTAIGIGLQVRQTRLTEIQTAPILEEQIRKEINSYENCKEPGNWDVKEGGATPGSKCREVYIKLRGKLGIYQPAEKILNQ